MWERQPVRSLLIPSTFQTSNPVPLGIWLYEQGLRYHVEFWPNTQAVSAYLSSTNEILSIKVIGDNKECFLLECDKLILAAGPWTPAVFTKLFPESSVNLEPVISAGECFVFQNSEPESEIAATFFDDIVGHKLEFAGRVSLSEHASSMVPNAH